MLVLGTTAAATLSFTAARGVGRRYAKKMLQTELGKGKGEGGANGIMAKQLTKVTAAMRTAACGSNSWQCGVAVDTSRALQVCGHLLIWLKCSRTLSARVTTGL